MNKEEAYPFKLGKIYPPDLDISKSWYIKFKVWDHSKGELVIRREMGGINKIHNKEERLKAARFVRDEVNALLKEGWTIGKEETVTTQFKHLPIVKAFEAAYEIKKISIAEGTGKDYVSLLKQLKQFSKDKGWGKSKIGQLTTSMVEAYLDELLKKGRANKTRNNHLGNIKALLTLMNRREKMWEIIPGHDISKLLTTSNKHAIYTRDQLQKNKQACIEIGEEYLWLYCQFMLFTLARPNELRMLKVEHLDLIDDRIYIPGENAKGRSGDWVDMYPPLKDLIIKEGLHKAPTSYYIFSNTQQPGPEPVGKNYFYKRHRKLLEKIGLDKSERNYDLYSYKHSGCCHLYMAEVDLISIQRQCRHKSPEQTMKYLREIGMLRKKDHFSKVTAF